MKTTLSFAALLLLQLGALCVQAQDAQPTPTPQPVPALQPSPTPEATSIPPTDRILVVAAKAKDLETDYYLWAAEMTAARLKGNVEVLHGGLAAALEDSRTHRGTVQGIVEVMVDVYTYYEQVAVICYDSTGRELWKHRTRLNSGGSEEKMARSMLERVLNKLDKESPCGKPKT